MHISGLCNLYLHYKTKLQDLSPSPASLNNEVLYLKTWMLWGCLISLSFNLQCLCLSSITNFYLQSLIPFLILLGTYRRYNTRLSSRMTYAIPKARTKFQNHIKLLSFKFLRKRFSQLFAYCYINCRFTNTIFFAFCCLILAYLAFSCCFSVSNSYFLFFLFSLLSFFLFSFCVMCSVCACVVPHPLI